MRRIRLFITTLVLLKSISVFAQNDATGETKLYLELNFAERELKLAYRQALRNLSEKQQRILKDQQRDWVKKRDIKCKNNQDSGVYENKLRLDCLIQETIRRTEQLKNLKARTLEPM